MVPELWQVSRVAPNSPGEQSGATIVSEDTWAAMDHYVIEKLVPSDAALEAALRDSAKAGLPAINVSPPQGKLLHILARTQAARRILEVGTLGGYSTIWLARGLEKGGRVTTLELDADHAKVAKKNIERAGVGKVVDIRLGRAIETLPKLLKEKAGPFDLVFLDADKPSNPEYFEWSLKLSRKGTIIVIDNVVRNGVVLDEKTTNEEAKGIRRMNDLLSREKRVVATTIQTVGMKGYDGFTIALVVK